MNWNKAKTIFIITFLFLNVFLTWQLIEKDNANQVSMITEATIQERLDENQVTIAIDLPEVSLPGVHVIGKTIPWTEEMVANLGNQEVEIKEDGTLVSVLDEPYPLSEENQTMEIQTFLNTYVKNGSEYRIGEWDSNLKQLHLYQNYEGKTTYTYEDDQLILQLDDEQQIVGYQQSLLEFSQHGREHEMLSSLKAIEVLMNDHIIGMNDTITTVEFGYYSFFSPQGDVQVFAPMWRIGVDDEIYLVNAIEWSIQQLT
ncbi:two-component system regulatory protein YycI [Halalkalibacterium ligniniphilum]|uniref:two-component system regulatory protein YycI n=1 Tax=Halalkalibacterium ligniniphilum TaxID=1134413 RepID=UPI00034A1509|nr:two-component system regulatory protein YycI [Halalkalibacterium ligniniphilum]